MRKIDKIDREIIQLLSVDGRISSAELARRIPGASERLVRYRLDRLLERGMIKVSAVVDPQKFGFPVIADVFIEVQPGMVLEVARRLADLDCTSYVACSTGASDISVQVVAQSNAEVYSLVNEVVAKVPGVIKTTTTIVPMIIKDRYHWHAPVEDYQSAEDDHFPK